MRIPELNPEVRQVKHLVREEIMPIGELATSGLSWRRAGLIRAQRRRTTATDHSV